MAKKLEADDYGMKNFVFVILKTGNNTSADQELISSSFRGHMENLKSLVEAKKLIVAVPFGKNNDNYRGLFILDVPTLDEAKELLQTDPAIKENLLEAVLYEWYGSAALSEYLEASIKVWKIKP